ncbi:MAG: sigma factor G inhibitor Gin [Dehalobacterium sp.]
MMEKCLVCNDSTPLCSEGMFIQGKFLCHWCTEMITSLKAEDIYYPFVKDSLKKIWGVNTERRYLS